MLCCGYTLTDFPISIRLASLALWQSNDCPSASKSTLMNMDKYFMSIHYERLHNHNKAKHNKTVCIFLGIYCIAKLHFLFLSLKNLLRSTHKCRYCFPLAGFFADEYCKARHTNHLAVNHAASINEYYYDDVIMTTLASQITSLTVVYSTVHSDADQRKHQSSASLAFVWGIHRDRWIPRTKGQFRGNCFHLMTS